MDALDRFLDLFRTKAGKRHSAADEADFQKIHDLMVDHGAQCKQAGASMWIQEKEGKLWWIMVSSSAFEDRDRELITTKALEADVRRADRTKNYGPLLWWHTDAVLGDCRYNAMHGKLLVEAGTFRSKEVGLRIKAAADRLGGSLGFKHPANEPDENGEFHTIFRYERSLLPKARASNFLTTLRVVTKETRMDKTKEKELLEILGGDEALKNEVLSTIEARQKEAEELGLRTKEKKADEKKAFPPKKDDEEEGEEEEAPAPKKPGQSEAQAEAEAMEEEDKKGKKKEAQTISDMTVDQLTQLISTSITGVLNERTTKEAELGTQLKEVKTATEAVANAIGSLKQTVEKVELKVKELDGDQPSGARGKGFRPSQEESTITKKNAETLKNMQPSADSFLFGIIDAMDGKPAA